MPNRQTKNKRTRGRIALSDVDLRDLFTPIKGSRSVASSFKPVADFWYFKTAKPCHCQWFKHILYEKFDLKLGFQPKLLYGEYII